MSNESPENLKKELLTEKLKFDNVYKELEFFKKKCDVMEKDLFKSQTTNKKNDLIIKKLQDMNAIYGKNTNNTSNSFLLPSEFKSNWESLIKDQIMEAFDNTLFDYKLLTYLVQDSIQIIYDESLELIKEKIINLLNALNITIQEDKDKDKDSYKEKNKKNKNETENLKAKKIKDNEKNECNTFLEYEKYLCKFRLIFQEYFSVIFQLNDLEMLGRIREKLKILINSDEVYKISEEKLELIEEDLNSKFFTQFFSSVFKLCLYMHLHEPKLTFNFPSAFSEKNPVRKLCYFYYKKDEFINIEGFPKEKSSCVVILPYPILRGNYSYQGIKPAVYIVPDPNEEIIRICEDNNKEVNNVKEKIKKIANENIDHDKDKEKPDNINDINFEDVCDNNTEIIVSNDKEIIPLAKKEFKDDVNFKISKIDKIVGNELNNNNLNIKKSKSVNNLSEKEHSNTIIQENNNHKKIINQKVEEISKIIK